MNDAGEQRRGRREGGAGGEEESKEQKKKTHLSLSSLSKATLRKLPDTLEQIVAACKEAREANQKCSELIEPLTAAAASAASCGWGRTIRTSSYVFCSTLY